MILIVGNAKDQEFVSNLVNNNNRVYWYHGIDFNNLYNVQVNMAQEFKGGHVGGILNPEIKVLINKFLEIAGADYKELIFSKKEIEEYFKKRKINSFDPEKIKKYPTKSNNWENTNAWGKTLVREAREKAEKFKGQKGLVKKIIMPDVFFELEPKAKFKSAAEFYDIFFNNKKRILGALEQIRSKLEEQFNLKGAVTWTELGLGESGTKNTSA